MKSVAKLDRLSKRRHKRALQRGHKCGCFLCVGNRCARYSKREQAAIGEPVSALEEQRAKDIATGEIHDTIEFIVDDPRERMHPLEMQP